MANPRQRRKARSSTHRPVSHSRHAKRNLKKTPPIRGPRALQEAWDKRKTVKQNYARLGLVHDLNPIASGGSEKQFEPQSGDEDSEMRHTSPSDFNTSPDRAHSRSLRKGFGRIVRDEVGNVIGVELPEEDSPQAIPPENQTMEHLEPELDGDVRELWTTRLGGHVGSNTVGLVEELESIAARKHLDSTTLSIAQSSDGPHLRHPAPGEVTYLQRLLNKYGDNVERMAKDRKLNPDQKTEGQLRRALRNAGFLKT